jgi:hypothetical protein
MSRVKIYFDFADWWIGCYIGPNHLYFCALTLVVRVRRATSDARARHNSHQEAS